MMGDRNSTGTIPTGVAAVTGGRGVIGRWIVEELLRLGWQVKLLSRSAVNTNQSAVTIITGEITDRQSLKKLLQGVDAVFHCAGELSDESKMHSVNVHGVEVLLQCLSNSPAKYFCHLSSAGVVGPTNNLLVNETTECNPGNSYEKTKFQAEQLVLSSSLDMSVCVLRPTNVVDQSQPGIIGLGLRNGLKERLTCFLKGREGAHVVHAREVARAAIHLQSLELKRAQVYFVSQDGEKQNTVAGVYTEVRRLVQKSYRQPVALPTFIFHRARSIIRGKSLHGDVRFSSEKLLKTGFSFEMTLDDIVRDICLSKPVYDELRL